MWFLFFSIFFLTTFEKEHAENWQWHRCFSLTVSFNYVCSFHSIVVAFALTALTLRWDLMVWKFSPTLQGVTTCCGRLIPGWIWWILPQQRCALLYLESSVCFKNEKTLSIWTVIPSNSYGDKNKAMSVHYTVKKLLCHCNLTCFAYI